MLKSFDTVYLLDIQFLHALSSTLDVEDYQQDYLKISCATAHLWIAAAVSMQWQSSLCPWADRDMVKFRFNAATKNFMYSIPGLYTYRLYTFSRYKLKYIVIMYTYLHVGPIAISLTLLRRRGLFYTGMYSVFTHVEWAGGYYDLWKMQIWRNVRCPIDKSKKGCLEQ